MWKTGRYVRSGSKRLRPERHDEPSSPAICTRAPCVNRRCLGVLAAADMDGAAPMSSLTTYRNKCRQIHKIADTTERSYYPAVIELLDEHTALSITPHSELSHSAQSKPDLGLYESDIRTLYVEVKLTDVSASQLLGLEQAYRYAELLAGWVLITNLNDYVLARIENGELVEQSRVRLFATDIDGERAPRLTKDASQKLRDILSIGCAQRQTLREARDVARLLAVHAKSLAALLPSSAFTQIKAGFKGWLGAELDDRFLVSTTVQAVVYGIFATWLESDEPEQFRWQDARDSLDVGVIADIVYSALPPRIVKLPKVEGMLEGIEGILRRVDRDAFARQFDGRAIEYFYEPFLNAYDAVMRDSLGIWFTPPAIAAYQVARADRHLRDDLHVAGGLANASVIVLDPAVGTGTYLAAVYDHLYDTYIQDGYSDTEAGELLRQAAKTRLVGFDILPSALVIADLNLRLKLERRGVALEPGDRAAVFLANSLTGWFDKDDPDEMALEWPSAKEEVEVANRYKHDEPVLVVLGNPPYEGYSSAVTPDEQKLVLPWTTPLASEWGIRKHRLNDLYIRFWAVAARRIATFTKMGVVSFISNRKWLVGRSYPAMRDGILSDFDYVIVDDLGGDSRGAGGGAEDESVFSTAIASGIQVGTAIVTAIRYPEANKDAEKVHSSSPEKARVRYRTLTGSGDEKRAELDKFRNDQMDQGLQSWQTNRDIRWKLGGIAATDDWIAIDEYFDYRNSGVQPVRDAAVTDHDYDDLVKRIAAYYDTSICWTTLATDYPSFAVQRKRYDGPLIRQRLLQRNTDTGRSGHDKNRLVRCVWKPLSGRWLYWEPDYKLLNEARRDMVPYWQVPNQVCMVATETRRSVDAARPIVSMGVPLFESMDPNARVLPLWKPHQFSREGELFQGIEDDESGHLPNIGEDWIAAAKAVGLSGSDREMAETVFYALCGVAASPEWLATQPVEHDDFPAIPIPADPSALVAAAETGWRYAALVDPWIDVPGVTEPPFDNAVRGIAVADSPKHGNPVLAYGRKGQLGGKVNGTSLLWATNEGWRNIPADVLDFRLGGFRPIQKHLAYFKDEPLTLDHRQLVTKMARRIVAILALAPESNAHFAAAKASPLELITV